MATEGITRKAYKALRPKENTCDDFEVIRCIVNCSRFENVRTAKRLQEVVYERVPNLTKAQLSRCLKTITDSMGKD